MAGNQQFLKVMTIIISALRLSIRCSLEMNRNS
jgi:hypothetical protein